MSSALRVLQDEQSRLPALARSALHGLAAQLRGLASEISRTEAQIVAWHKADEQSRRLAAIPGVGPITASAMAAAVPDISPFRSGRQFAERLGLTPRANSSGGKERLGGITKQGDGYLRRLLVVGATAMLRAARKDLPASNGRPLSWSGKRPRLRRSQWPTRPRASLGR